MSPFAQFPYCLFRSPPPEAQCLLGAMVGLALLTGCTGFSSEEKQLPDSTFRQVLTELHLATNRKTLHAPYPSGLRDSIFTRYGVRRSEFDATLRYYSRHPKAFELLYQSVIDTLQAMQYSKDDRASNQIPDSLKKNGRKKGQSP